MFDLKAVYPNRTSPDDRRNPDELLVLIEEKGRETDAALARLRQLRKVVPGSEM